MKYYAKASNLDFYDFFFNFLALVLKEYQVVVKDVIGVLVLGEPIG